MRKIIKIANLKLDGKRIYVQSMLNKRSDDVKGNVEQALELERFGCEVLRVSIPDEKSLKLISSIKDRIKIPLVADIHYDYKLAVKAADMGIDKIRINPGNIGGEDNVKVVAQACKNKNIPIRIGVNGGSLSKTILAKYGKPTAEALVESAAEQVKMLERFGFYDIVISLKSSDLKTMIAAYRQANEKLPYPLHLGITEAGTERMGIIKSAIGIGSLLADGIGETIRVSLTAEPVKEIAAAMDILKCVGKHKCVDIISCPTCGRTRIDVIKIADEIEKKTRHIFVPLKIAVMGCAVNGIGEGKEADIGIAGGDGEAVLFKKGEIVRKIAEQDILPTLLEEISLIT